jgi:hypothetical protein
MLQNFGMMHDPFSDDILDNFRSHFDRRNDNFDEPFGNF